MQQSVLDWIDRSLLLMGDFFESRSYQQGARDVIARDARFTTLAPLDARKLLDLAVILLDLPAKSTRLLRALGGITRSVVSHDPLRAVRRHLNPEKSHLVVFGKAAHLDDLAALPFLLAPFQLRHMAVRPHPVAIVHHTVALERAVENLGVGVGSGIGA